MQGKEAIILDAPRRPLANYSVNRPIPPAFPGTAIRKPVRRRFQRQTIACPIPSLKKLSRAAPKSYFLKKFSPWIFAKPPFPRTAARCPSSHRHRVERQHDTQTPAAEIRRSLLSGSQQKIPAPGAQTFDRPRPIVGEQTPLHRFYPQQGAYQGFVLPYESLKIRQIGTCGHRAGYPRGAIGSLRPRGGRQLPPPYPASPRCRQKTDDRQSEAGTPTPPIRDAPGTNDTSTH